MADTVRCRIEHARVRPEQQAAFEQLIHQMFARRNHAYIASSERLWLGAELVQSLRRRSSVYRALSTKMSGPLPFAIGYLRVRDGQVELVSDAVPCIEADVFARLLSEYVEPGARIWMGDAGEVSGWRIDGVDDIAPLAPADAPSM